LNKNSSLENLLYTLFLIFSLAIISLVVLNLAVVPLSAGETAAKLRVEKASRGPNNRVAI
jgi:hypothetical protein